MTQEEKDLLFKDLSARLPYHVRVKIWIDYGTEEGILDLEHNYADVLLHAFYYNKIKKIKPYLRPMSSMTEEEAGEYNDLVNELSEYNCQPEQSANKMINWLLAHHFDYQKLIEKGFAIEAPEGMYNTKIK